MTSIKEIGSEYWLGEHRRSQIDGFSPQRFGFVGDVSFPLSGRTAIRCIIEDLEACGKFVRKAFLPAYCCDSMVYPFAQKGVNVEFYDEQPDFRSDIDLLYVNNYFGFPTEIDYELVRKYKDFGKIVVYDRTHALMLENDAMVALADYSFSSFRKWMDVPVGAVLCKHGGSFVNCSLKPCGFVDERIEAMRLKADFVAGKPVSKEQFFAHYNAFAHHLTEDYAGYGMDAFSYERLQKTDFEMMRQQRIANIEVLYEGLKENANITFWQSLTECCLLFFPILCRNKKERDGLRQHLTHNQVYCPIHWPKGDWVQPQWRANAMLDCELSLVCDQRYNTDDMHRIVELIQEYYTII